VLVIGGKMSESIYEIFDKSKPEEREVIEKRIRDEEKKRVELLEVMRFIESLATKLASVSSQADLFATVMQEINKSYRYNSMIFLLEDDGKHLRMVESVEKIEEIKASERVSGISLKRHQDRFE